jgi:hypothetical protein
MIARRQFNLLAAVAFGALSFAAPPAPPTPSPSAPSKS